MEVNEFVVPLSCFGVGFGASVRALTTLQSTIVLKDYESSLSLIARNGEMEKGRHDVTTDFHLLIL